MELVMLGAFALVGWVYYLDRKDTDNVRKALEGLLTELEKEKEE